MAVGQSANSAPKVCPAPITGTETEANAYGSPIRSSGNRRMVSSGPPSVTVRPLRNAAGTGCAAGTGSRANPLSSEAGTPATALSCKDRRSAEAR